VYNYFNVLHGSKNVDRSEISGNIHIGIFQTGQILLSIRVAFICFYYCFGYSNCRFAIPHENS